MRFEILAFAAIAATASADAATDAANETACDTWKAEVYAAKAVTDGWTLEDRVLGVQIYKSSNGNVINDWTSFSGYDTSKCSEVEVAAAEKDGAAYLATGAALAAFVATLAF